VPRVRRVLIAPAIAFAGIALVVALKPFSVSGGQLRDSSGRTFVALTSSESCGAPIVAAWHGKDDIWAVPIGPNIAGSVPGSSETELIPLATCRSVAQHRLRIAGLWLVASIAVGGGALFLGHRFGLGSEAEPA
jgi:hypothetical protein